jgi:Flp pilus assembly protein TadD
MLAGMLAGEQVDSTGGCTPVGGKDLTEAWQHLQDKYPSEFSSSPADAVDWHERAAGSCEAIGDWFGAIVHLDILVDAQPRDWQLRRRRADAYAASGIWEKADAEYSAAIKHGDRSTSVWRRRALVLLKRSRPSDYRDVCTGMLDRFAETEDAAAAGTLIRTCVLAPQAVPDLAPLSKLCEKVQKDAESRRQMFPGTAGALLCRRGEFEAAVRELGPAAHAHPGPTAAYAWLFLAMSHHGRGETEMARDFLRKTAQWLDHDLPEKVRIFGFMPIPWDDILELQLIRREAESLIGANETNRRSGEEKEPDRVD